MQLCVFAMTTVDWRGGWSVSVRYLVPAIPFLLEGVAAAITTTVAIAVFMAGALLGILQVQHGHGHGAVQDQMLSDDENCRTS